MPTSHRRFAAALVATALVTAAVVLIAGGGRPVVAFIADLTGHEDGSVERPLPAGAPSVPMPFPIDAGAWGPDDGDDPDAAAWADPAVRPLKVRVTGLDQTPAPGVPVVILGRAENGPVLAGPKLTNSEGRVRFPIDLAMEQVHEVVVAGRAVPGRAATVAVTVALDQPSEVTLPLDVGIRASIAVVDVEGRPIEGPARVRKVILEDGSAETGPRAALLAQVFAETTPRAVRTKTGFELVGLRTPDDVTLLVSAPGYAPSYRSLQIPPQVSVPFPVEVKLETRTSVVRFEVAASAGFDRDKVEFSCHRVEASAVLVAAGSDEVPAQKSPKFSVDVPPNDAHRLEVLAWVDGRVQASGEVEVPALREGEVLDAGAVRLEMLPVVLAGRVVDEDQSPLVNAKVQAIGTGRSRDLAATTGSDGVFALRARSGGGPYQVSAHAPGRVSENLTGVAEPATDLRLVLEPSGAIQGSLLVAAPMDSDRISVRAATSGRAPFVTTLQSDGSFTISGLPRGVYSVVIEGGGIEPIRVADVLVNPPEVTRDSRLDRLRPRGLMAQGQP
jgi:hypothetical protein